MNQVIKKIIFLLFILSVLLHTITWAKTVRSGRSIDQFESHTSPKAIKIVTSIPDIADMCQIIGGDLVKVKSIARGTEDIHAVPLKPSFVVQIRQSDILFSLGLDAEHAWLPPLVRSARSKTIYPGSDNWATIEKGIAVLGVPEIISRKEGEQHIDGNPHYNLGADSGVIMSSNIYFFLAQKYPAHQKIFYKNWTVYKEKITALQLKLKKEGRNLKNKKIITYHADLNYLAHFYGMKIVETLEVKPGVPPTISHLKKIKDLAKRESIDYVFCTQSQDKRLSRKVAKDLGIPFVEVASGVGAKKEIKSWADLQKHNLSQILSSSK